MRKPTTIRTAMAATMMSSGPRSRRSRVRASRPAGVGREQGGRRCLPRRTRRPSGRGRACGARPLPPASPKWEAVALAGGELLESFGAAQGAPSEHATESFDFVAEGNPVLVDRVLEEAFIVFALPHLEHV